LVWSFVYVRLALGRSEDAFAEFASTSALPVTRRRRRNVLRDHCGIGKQKGQRGGGHPDDIEGLVIVYSSFANAKQGSFRVNEAGS